MSTTVTPRTGFTVTEEMKRQFREDGVVHLPQVIEPTFLELIAIGIRRNVNSPGPYRKRHYEGTDREFYDDYCNYAAVPEYRMLLRDSPIVGVGVDENGALAVTGVRQVGWYEFGPRPGDHGSSAFAGHIAFGGVAGVFRRLASTKVGGDVVVRFVDGSSVAFVVTRVERIDKDELPAELFASSGPAQLVLISCGGAFNRDRQSYEDNIVVIARPTNWSTSR